MILIRNCLQQLVQCRHKIGDRFLCYLLLLEIACFEDKLGDLLVGLLNLDVWHTSI
jgi:hypothetical protein